jgi:hypothetical protein
MKSLRGRRPSAGVIIGFLALAVALGGGAYAAKKKTKTKVEYKGLSKEARLKVLPVGGTNAGTAACDPQSNTTFTDCTSVTTKQSAAFPRRNLIVFDGIFSGATATSARGDCRLEVDNAPINGTNIKVDAPGQSAGGDKHGIGAGINIVTTPLGGEHTFSVACNETDGDLKVHQYQLSVIGVR